MIKINSALRQRVVDYYCLIYQRYLSRTQAIPIYTLKNNLVQKDIVNIVGSGVSAIETLVDTDDTQAFITCNLSIALRKFWDVVLVEYDAIPSFRRPLCKALDQARCDVVLLKNNYLHGPIKDFNYYRNHKGIKELYILNESQSQTAFDGVLEMIVDFLQERDISLVRQYSSSVFTMIIIGLTLKPKILKLHGIDFGGESFYKKPEFKVFRPGALNHISEKGANVAGIGIRAELLQVKSLLANYGIELIGHNL